MKRFLKRCLFPIIITILVITIFGLFNLAGGQYDGLASFTVYDLMFGAKFNNSVEFFNVSAMGVIVAILLIAGAILSWIDFKFDKLVLSIIFVLATVGIMLLPITVNKTEVATYIVKMKESGADGFMTILVGTYVTAAISLIISCFALFKSKFNSLFRISK